MQTNANFSSARLNGASLSSVSLKSTSLKSALHRNLVQRNLGQRNVTQRHLLQRLTVLVAVMLLASCVSQPPKVNPNADIRRTTLEQLDTFKVTGGLSFWTDEESISTRIEWLQSGQDFDVTVRAPAGLRTVNISQKDGLAVLKNGKSGPVSGRSASLLLQQALGLGVAIPIAQMSLWIKGLPGEQAESVKYDDQQRLVSMNYRDSQSTLWRTKVLSYGVFRDAFVPATIVATGGPYTIRLVLRKWSSDQLPAIAETEVSDQEVTTGSTRLKVPGR